VARAQRFEGLDVVRAAAMLLGLAYHATYAYVPAIGPWYPVVDGASSEAFAALAAVLHSFRMEVFFALSGFFSALLVERRGPDGFLRERARRLGWPFAIAMPLTIAADQLVRRFSELRGAMASDYHWGTELRVMPLHLWFLEYLLLFCTLTWVLVRLAPRLPAGWAARALAVPEVLLLGALPTAVIAVQHPELRPDLSFVPEWQSVLHHGLFFAFGFVLWGASDASGALQRRGPAMLAVGLALSGWLYSQPLQWTSSGAALGALVAWLVTLGVLGLGLRPWRTGPAVRLLVDASYWMYLVHYPVVVLLQVLLVPLAWPAVAKYALVVAAMFAVACGSFVLFVRRSFLAPYLGVRRPDASAER